MGPYAARPARDPHMAEALAQGGLGSRDVLVAVRRNQPSPAQFMHQDKKTGGEVFTGQAAVQRDPQTQVDALPVAWWQLQHQSQRSQHELRSSRIRRALRHVSRARG